MTCVISKASEDRIGNLNLGIQCQGPMLLAMHYMHPRPLDDFSVLFQNRC